MVTINVVTMGWIVNGQLVLQITPIAIPGAVPGLPFLFNPPPFPGWGSGGSGSGSGSGSGPGISVPCCPGVTVPSILQAHLTERPDLGGNCNGCYDGVTFPIGYDLQSQGWRGTFDACTVTGLVLTLACTGEAWDLFSDGTWGLFPPAGPDVVTCSPFYLKWTGIPISFAGPTGSCGGYVDLEITE